MGYQKGKKTTTPILMGYQKGKKEATPILKGISKKSKKAAAPILMGFQKSGHTYLKGVFKKVAYASFITLKGVNAGWFYLN